MDSDKNEYNISTKVDNPPPIHVTINYGSEEPFGFQLLYKCVKLFEFKYIPTVTCKIMLDNDAIEIIDFNDIYFDPEKNIYYVTNKNTTNLERYYMGEKESIVAMNIKTFKRFGWLVARQ